MSFGLYNQFPHLRRIIVLDADQLVLRSLDHLFLLPSVRLAAPRAYWLDDRDASEEVGLIPPRHDELTSALMVIEQAPETWAKVMAGLADIALGTYDMDLVQALFRETALVLPGSYTTLNSHWEAWDLPAWYTGNARGDAEVVPEYERGWNVSDRRMVVLYNEAYVVHFTAGGKPWELGKRYQVEKKHWLFREQVRMWREGLTGSMKTENGSVEDTTRGYELHGPVLGAKDLCLALAETVAEKGQIEDDVLPSASEAELDCIRTYLRSDVPVRPGAYEDCLMLASQTAAEQSVVINIPIE